MAPERHLQETRLHPGGVHLLDVLGRVSLLREERLERERHREDQKEQVAERHDPGRCCTVRAVFLRAVVAEADLVLVVEPRLIVLGPGRIEDPLAEASADSAEVVTERLAVVLAGERREQVRGRADEPVPDIEDGLDLIRQIRVMDERAGTRTPAAALSALARMFGEKFQG